MSSFYALASFFIRKHYFKMLLKTLVNVFTEWSNRMQSLCQCCWNIIMIYAELFCKTDINFFKKDTISNQGLQTINSDWASVRGRHPSRHLTWWHMMEQCYAANCPVPDQYHIESNDIAFSATLFLFYRFLFSYQLLNFLYAMFCLESKLWCIHK